MWLTEQVKTMFVLKLPSGKEVSVDTKKMIAEVQTPELVLEDNNGNRIFSKRQTNFGQVFDNFKYVKVDADGKIVSDKELKTMLIKDDGTKVEAIPYTKTSRIVFDESTTIPRQVADRMIQESLYEVYASDPEGILALADLAEECLKTNTAYAVDNFSWMRGFNTYYALFYPIKFDEFRFGWMLKTSQGVTRYQRIMDKRVELPRGERVQNKPKLSEVLVGLK